MAEVDALVQFHRDAAVQLHALAGEHEQAAEHYQHGLHERAAHYALLAHAHLQHTGQFMSDAAKIHAELHGGNRHTVI
jgi:hypothetical protein